MEWVETTGKTLAEAKEAALDQLGVHEEDAEFDVLEEPQQGLFGRVRGEARVRARVRPAQARQKVDRRDRKRAERAESNSKTASSGTTVRRPRAEATGAKEGSGGEGSSPKPARSRTTKQAPRQKPQDQADSPDVVQDPAVMKERKQIVDATQVGEEARRFVDELVAAFRLDGTTELVADGDDLEVRVHGQELGLLVGPRGTTLQAVQDLTRVASQRRLGDHDTRLRVDVGGYRERRRAALATFATQMAAEVTASGVARVLEPMSSADRKVIHDTLSDVEDISTRSEGDDPYRRVVIAPSNA
ncbi:MAG: Jag N-terminal domain-containing protein [Actinobacteria bacterium]|nr:Jag N-terminal domain-containing protein [Actinomycetota bacterium]